MKHTTFFRIHTGEKPHQCTRCPRSFSRVYLLQLHQRTHTGERPYACNVCSKSFAQQGDLASHKRIHSGGLRCAERKWSLTTDLSINFVFFWYFAGERPHTCKVCSKGFIKSSGLTLHMKRHRTWDASHDRDKDDSTAEKNNDETNNVYVLLDGFNENRKTSP